MAVKEISLPGKKKKTAKTRIPVRVPAKRTMNFVHHQKNFNPRYMVPLLLAVVLLLGSFLKFGIVDQLAKKEAAYADLASRQDQLLALLNELSDYNEVEVQHGRYSNAWMDESETNLVDRMAVLDLVEKKISPKAVIEDVAINGNVLNLHIHGLTLEQASRMVEEIELSQLVSSASVYTAVAEEAEEASIFMSIILTKEAR